MAILLTGGSGFIGSHFHKFLPNKGLVNLDLNEPSFKSHSTFVKGDIRIESDVKKAVLSNDIKTIISLAAKHHDFGIGHDEYFDTNEDGTRVICKVATENNVKEIIFYSSVAVYGIRNEVSNEDMEPTPDSPYGASKLAGEKVLKEWAMEDGDRKVVIIRPAVVFGPGNYANMFNLIRQIDSGFYFHLGKADKIKSIAYVENVVQATAFLMSKMDRSVAIYNYADEPQLTTREISDTIAHHLRKKIYLTLPKKLGLLFGVPFDILIKITRKNFPISTARINKLDTSTHHSAAKIFSEGFEPDFSTYQGLMKMVEWYKGATPQ
jgi:nucleoside-diphosphate-sugar epimerase